MTDTFPNGVRRLTASEKEAGRALALALFAKLDSLEASEDPKDFEEAFKKVVPPSREGGDREHS